MSVIRSRTSYTRKYILQSVGKIPAPEGYILQSAGRIPAPEGYILQSAGKIPTKCTSKSPKDKALSLCFSFLISFGTCSTLVEIKISGIARMKKLDGH